MKATIKSLSFGAAATLLRPALLSRFRSNSLTILTYHGVVESLPKIPDPILVRLDDFRKQMAYLKQNFDVVTMRDAARLLQDGRLERRTAIVTFDDGYQNNYDLALPVLEEVGVPATVYVATRFLDTATTIWTGLLQHSFGITQATQLDWRGRMWRLETLDDRISCMLDVKCELKATPQHDLEDTISGLLEQLIGSRDVSLDTSSPYRMLDKRSVRLLAQSDLIDLGTHTHNHHILSRISKEEQDREIREAKEAIESITSEHCGSFAYPNGQPEDFNADTIAILKDCGFNSAVTTVNGLCDITTDRALELPRIAVDGRSGFSQFKLGLFNIPGCFRTRT